MPLIYFLNPKINSWVTDSENDWILSLTPLILWTPKDTADCSSEKERCCCRRGGLTSPTKNRRACTQRKQGCSCCLFNRPQFPLSNLGSSQGTPPHPPPHPSSWNAGRSQESHFSGPKQLKQSKLALDLLHIRSSHTLWDSSVFKESKNC